jgi:hypothetical protein
MDGDYGPGDAPGPDGSFGAGGGDGSIGDYQGGGRDASFSGPSFDFSNYADEASGLSAGAYSKDVAQAIADMLGTPLGEGAATGRGFHSPGVSYAALNALAQAGLGKMDIPGFNQNIEQALAAQNVHNVLNYAAPAFAGLIPGYGTVSALGKGIANIHGLMTGRLSAEEVVPGLAAGLIGARTGIPSGILEGIFTGDLGKTVGSGAQAGLGALVSGITGNPMAGALASSTLGPAVNRAASEAVGGSKSGGLGGLFGGAGVPSTSSAPTGNTYGDTGINADAYSVLAAIEQAAQEPKRPEWSSQMTAGRYGPLMEYEFGA